MNGPALAAKMRAKGINVQIVERKQRTGEYVASFFVPETRTGVHSSGVWAAEIKHKLRGVTITATHDCIAHWREGQPVIEAMVKFTVASGGKKFPETITSRFVSPPASKAAQKASTILYIQ